MQEQGFNLTERLLHKIEREKSALIREERDSSDIQNKGRSTESYVDETGDSTCSS
jgi:hypothetical protein